MANMKKYEMWLKPLLMGIGVVLLTPFLAGLVSGIEFMATELLFGLTVGTMIAAGVAAFISEWVIGSYIFK